MKKIFSIVVGIITGLGVVFVVGYILKGISGTTSSSSVTRSVRFGGNGDMGSSFGRTRFGSGMSGMQYSGAKMGSGSFGGIGRNGTGNFMRGSGSRQGMGRGVTTGITSDPQQLLDQTILQK